MKNKNTSSEPASKPFKMSLAVSLLSNITAFVHFGLLVTVVLLVFNIFTFINNALHVPKQNKFESGVPARISSELKQYREYEKLSPEEFEVSVDTQNNQQIVKVKNLAKGETYEGIFTAVEISPNNKPLQYTELGSYGILRETVTDSAGLVITELGGQNVYDLSIISRSESSGANGILLFQTFQFVNFVLLVLIGFLASSKMYTFFKNVRKGSFFVRENSTFFRSAGVYALIALVLPMVLTFGLMIASTLQEYNFGWGSANNVLSTNWSLILVSALFLMLSEILQRGHELQLEKEMTI